MLHDEYVVVAAEEPRHGDEARLFIGAPRRKVVHAGFTKTHARSQSLGEFIPCVLKGNTADTNESPIA